MEMVSLKCPNCGANATNNQNCEYCGSLLVRFVDKGIDLSNTSYLDDSLVFPGLKEKLKENLIMQERDSENEGVWTEIRWKKNTGLEDWLMVYSDEDDSDDDLDSAPENKTLHKPQLIIRVAFINFSDNSKISFENNKEQDEQLMRFTQLKSYPLFTHIERERYENDDVYSRDFEINFGQDAEGAARLISEILIKVKGISPSGSYGIYTGLGDEDCSDDYKEWQNKYGFYSVLQENENEQAVVNEDIILDARETEPIEQPRSKSGCLGIIAAFVLSMGMLLYGLV